MSDRAVKLQRWVFVHNDEDGLASEVVSKLTELSQDNKAIDIQRWSFEMIWQKLKELDVDQLIELFGAGPSEASVEQLAVPEIIEVVSRLERQNPPPLADMTIPDAGKLEYNKLSPESELWLQMGRLKVGLVEKCFDTLGDPTAAERIAEAFRQKYASLRADQLPPDSIFSILWEFAGGVDLVGQKQQAAIAAVMAYFFNACDIFENVLESA